MGILRCVASPYKNFRTFCSQTSQLDPLFTIILIHNNYIHVYSTTSTHHGLWFFATFLQTMQTDDLCSSGAVVDVNPGLPDLRTGLLRLR